MNTEDKLKIIGNYGNWYEWGDQTSGCGISLIGSLFKTYMVGAGDTSKDAINNLYDYLKQEMIDNINEH